MIKYLEKQEEFIELTKKRCLVDFYADWCGPCQMLGEVLEEFASNHKDLNIIKINSDKFSDIAFKFGVMSIPTLIVMENGKEIKKSIGYMTLDQLEDFIK